jgi:hypothetical protein
MQFEYPHQPVHRLVLVQTLENGEDEWYCPECGRRVLIHWPPDYKKTVLEAGDEYAIHNGGKGGLQIGAAQVSQGQEEASTTWMEEDRLAQWETWLVQMDFESWWA